MIKKKKKLKELVSNTPALQEIVKGLLQDVMKEHKTAT